MCAVVLALSERSYIPLMVPLAVEEVGEAAGTHMHQLVEDRWNDSFVMYLKVHACVGRKSHKLLKDKPCGPFENGVNYREYEPCVCFSLMFVQ